MPTIDATNCATITNGGPVGWGGVTFSTRRDNTDGDTVVDYSFQANNSFTATYGRGPRIRVFRRVFAAFDTSGVSIAPSDATLKIYGRANYSHFGNADFFVVAGTQGTGDPTAADFDAIAGWDVSSDPSDGAGGGDQESNVTLYTAEWVNATTAWDESDYNELTLNAAARTAMVNVDNFYICIIESTHDLNDYGSGTTYWAQLGNGMYFDDDAGKEMQIDYTAGVAAAADNAIFFGTNF